MSLSQPSEINLTDNGKKTLDAKKLANNVDQKIQYKTFTVSASNPWDFNAVKSMYGNWFVNGDTSGNYFYNGPDGFAPFVYVQSRGSSDGSAAVTLLASMFSLLIWILFSIFFHSLSNFAPSYRDWETDRKSVV